MKDTRIALLSDRQKRSELDLLERRLEDGYRKIELAESMGEDVTGMEAFWLSLLRQYEDMHRLTPIAA